MPDWVKDLAQKLRLSNDALSYQSDLEQYRYEFVSRAVLSYTN